MDLSDRCSISDSELSFSERSECDSESTQSTPEEERIRRLFITCDTDGDGFITSQDIHSVCCQLNLEYSVDEIMEQLGADANGRISFPEFVQKRMELLDINASEGASTFTNSEAKDERDPLLDAESGASSSFESCSNPSINEGQAFSHENRSSVHCSSSGDSNQIKWRPFDTIIGIDSGSHAASSAKHASSCMECDSGTHDLEHETTIPLHKLIESSGNSLPTNINELLDIANEEVIDVKNRLHIVLKERDFLEHQIIALKDERIRITKELEKKRIKECQKYEEKITDLQSIIAELSLKMDTSQYMTIIEEEEEQNTISELEKKFNDGNSGFSSCGVSSMVKFSGEYGKKLFEIVNNEKIIKLEREITYLRDSNDALKEELCLKEKEMIHFQCALKESNVQFPCSIVSLCDTFDTKDFEHKTLLLEIDRLKCRITHLESQIDLTSLYNEESVNTAERLTVKLAKYESNNSALKLELEYADKALHINELLSALNETEVALVMANCRAAGLGKCVNHSEIDEREELEMIIQRLTERRKYAEDAALDYLLKNCDDFGGAIGGNIDFCRDDQIKLRQILEKLKSEKSIIKKSIVESESHDEEIILQRNITFKRNQNLDVENAVLHQDFMAIKEQNADLRSQLYMIQKESHYCKSVKYSDFDKSIQMQYELINNLDDVSKNNDNRVSDYNELIEELKIENEKLMEKTDKYRKKYYAKSKKMEHRISNLTQSHNAQVKTLQKQISQLEKELNCSESTL